MIFVLLPYLYRNPRADGSYDLGFGNATFYLSTLPQNREGFEAVEAAIRQGITLPAGVVLDPTATVTILGMQVLATNVIPVGRMSRPMTRWERLRAWLGGNQ